MSVVRLSLLLLYNIMMPLEDRSRIKTSLNVNNNIKINVIICNEIY